jgi:alpha-L-fucosidase
MKYVYILVLSILIGGNSRSQAYQPSAENLAARSEFQNNKFGLFIHWGPFSVLGDGEWVMNNENIPVKDYKKLADFFNPVSFDPQAWVSMAKDAGMKYITLITRHHDGFSMWDTKYSDFNIMNTPYKKDVVKMMADECRKQNIKLVLYYSLLDWGREDYPHETGRTGQKSGRKGKGDYPHYLQFMKNQLTELLTNYGDIAGIWFDGHWDQTNPEGDTNRTARIDWKYEEIYSLIHKLQPQCLIGNNHHLAPFSGEDFQMFERDLPGENKSGLSFQKASERLPLETCETMNDSWGFNIKDDNYKSVKELIHYLVNAAGRNANFLLNVGPPPNGKMQPEFSDTLQEMGKWLQKNGESIYGTRGNILPPQDWGVATGKNKTIYLHILKQPEQPFIINQFPGKVVSCKILNSNSALQFNQTKEGLKINLGNTIADDLDTIIKIETK